MRVLAADWPAMKKWREMDNLAHKLGNRLIPIEIGSMASGMAEKLVDFRTFVSTYLAPSAKRNCWSLEDATSDSSSEVAYLAQHPLLDQIQELYHDVESTPCRLQPINVNMWFGTGGTRTPLHFDSYNNLLIQIVVQHVATPLATVSTITFCLRQLEPCV
jgi:hypothetical protein